MTKKEFINYCSKLKLQCNYDGSTKTMYVSGNDAAKALKHFVVAGFKIVAKDNK